MLLTTPQGGGTVPKTYHAVSRLPSLGCLETDTKIGPGSLGLGTYAGGYWITPPPLYPKTCPMSGAGHNPVLGHLSAPKH